MTPQQALLHLYQMARTAPASADAHEAAQEAARLLDELVNPRPKPEAPAEPTTLPPTSEESRRKPALVLVPDPAPTS